LILADDLPGSPWDIGMTTRRDWKPTRAKSLFIEKLKEVVSEVC